MPKILLVEDDNNLREIFEMRLQADGYKTLSAGDGEAALSMAMKEKPDLIIADVMMPRMSGFEMIETLRSAPEMANTKVIMMTALGQAEDQARGAKLGVLKYLVKSQVTLEDFARVVHEVIGGSTEASQASNNKVKGDNPMDPNPTNAAPSDGTNPISNDPTSSQPSMADEKQAMDDNANAVMNNNDAGAMPGGTGDAGAPVGGDTAMPPAQGDVPVTPPPSGDDTSASDPAAPSTPA